MTQQGPTTFARRVLIPVAMRVLPWVLMVFLWYLVPTLGVVKPGLVPTPGQVLVKFWEQFTQHKLYFDMYMSFQRVTLGLLELNGHG